MCIIVYKPINIDYPSKAELKRLFASNPDGAGFMYADGGDVVIRRGFMSFKALYNALPRTRGDVVIHMRIATHGGVNPRLTHPFPVTTNTRKLTRLECRARYGVAHNGVVDITSDTKELSDTAVFVRDYVAPLYALAGASAWSNSLLEAAAGSSRLAIMSADGVALLGRWYEHNGVYYSNKGYEHAPRYSWSDYYAGYYSGYYDYDGYAERWREQSAQADTREYSAYTLGISDDGRITEGSGETCC